MRGSRVLGVLSSGRTTFVTMLKFDKPANSVIRRGPRQDGAIAAALEYERR